MQLRTCRVCSQCLGQWYLKELHILCAVHPTPRQHPCYPPTMSLSKPFNPLYPIITPTLHDHPRTNLVPWKIAVFAKWDQFGFLFGVCDDAVWAILNTPPGGQLRARPDFPAPADLAAGDGPAVRDAFKRATAARAAWLAVSATFCAAMLDSIPTQTPSFCPRETSSMR